MSLTQQWTAASSDGTIKGRRRESASSLSLLLLLLKLVSE
jgi:hypothetical protein